MENYPANMIDLMDMLPTEEPCLEYLIQVRWPEGYAFVEFHLLHPRSQHTHSDAKWSLFPI